MNIGPRGNYRGVLFYFNEILKKKKNILIGLVDADLLDNGTRHPNLVLLKLAGYFRDKGISYELIIDTEANLERYHRVYLSRVFAFTSLPKFVTDFQKKHPRTWKNTLQMGGTGFYATEENRNKFDEMRYKDMTQLEMDSFLPGFSMSHQMPDYDIYTSYIEREIEKKINEESRKLQKRTGNIPTTQELNVIKAKCRKKYKDYLDYSIGFLTRGCIRQCPFYICKRNEDSENFRYLR